MWIFFTILVVLLVISAYGLFDSEVRVDSRATDSGGDGHTLAGGVHKCRGGDDGDED